MGALATPLVLVLFAGAAAATWVAGVLLSRTTDALDVRLGLGEELGGVVLLAVAGSLPEVAITVSAAARGNLGLAAGNLIGGIAVQTLVVAGVLMGALLPASTAIGPVSPASIAIVVVWLAGIYVINRVRKRPRWSITMPGSRPGR